jgi:hypothetical protein
VVLPEAIASRTSVHVMSSINNEFVCAFSAGLRGGREETHCGGAAPKADGPGRPSRAFVANADSIRQHRRTVYRGTTWLKVCLAESSQSTEKITDRAHRHQQRLTLRESRVRWVLWGAAQY